MLLCDCQSHYYYYYTTTTTTTTTTCCNDFKTFFLTAFRIFITASAELPIAYVITAFILSYCRRSAFITVSSHHSSGWFFGRWCRVIRESTLRTVLTACVQEAVAAIATRERVCARRRNHRSVSRHSLYRTRPNTRWYTWTYAFVRTLIRTDNNNHTTILGLDDMNLH